VLRVTVEIVPHGVEANKKTLATFAIGNTMQHEGRPRWGDYDVAVESGEDGHIDTFAITDHWRLHGWALLASRAIEIARNRGFV
jgi:hypothetical protein